VGKTGLLHLNRNKPIIITELQLNLQKYINICCCSFKNIDKEKKTALQEKFDSTINFDLMINFDFFWPNNLGFPHGVSEKFGLWTFHKL